MLRSSLFFLSLCARVRACLLVCVRACVRSRLCYARAESQLYSMKFGHLSFISILVLIICYYLKRETVYRCPRRNRGRMAAALLLYTDKYYLSHHVFMWPDTVAVCCRLRMARITSCSACLSAIRSDPIRFVPYPRCLMTVAR